MSELVSRQVAINALKAMAAPRYKDPACEDMWERDRTLDNAIAIMRDLPSAQIEPCEYCALCRHGVDENKLRVHLGVCEYCNEDSDGHVKPIEKNNHAFVRFGMNGWELSLKANGWRGSAKIRYCPMCGRDLFVK